MNVHPERPLDKSEAAKSSLPISDPAPITWFCRLRRAIAEGDLRLEQLARAELRKIGWLVKVAKGWRKGGR
jgi:hypothetical protein